MWVEALRQSSMPVAVFSLAVTELFACAEHTYSGDLSNADAAVPPLLGRGPRPPTPDVRAALHDPDSLFGEASEKLTQRKEVNQAADHDGRQPRQHNVRIR